MRKTTTILVVLVVAIIALIVLSPFYIVREGEQAVVIRFGEIVASTQEAGLHFKVPMVDNVVTYSARLLSWDGDPVRMPTRERQFIWVDTTARWRIIDPRQFYTAVTTMNAAFARLDELIDPAVRTIVAQNDLAEAVRDSNIINQIDRSESLVEIQGVDDAETERLREITSLLPVVDVQPSIAKGRRELSNEMFDRARETAADLGIEIEDVVIRQIRYSEDVTDEVFDRMVSERRQIAELFRSYGEGRRQAILGEMENDRQTILSEAEARAEEIRGVADATAAQIYSAAYSQNPQFFEFWRSIQSYRETLPRFRATLSTDLDYFDYLYSETGQ